MNHAHDIIHHHPHRTVGPGPLVAPKRKGGEPLTEPLPPILQTMSRDHTAVHHMMNYIHVTHLFQSVLHVVVPSALPLFLSVTTRE